MTTTGAIFLKLSHELSDQEILVNLYNIYRRQLKEPTEMENLLSWPLSWEETHFGKVSTLILRWLSSRKLLWGWVVSENCINHLVSRLEKEVMAPSYCMKSPNFFFKMTPSFYLEEASGQSRRLGRRKKIWNCIFRKMPSSAHNQSIIHFGISIS